MRLLITGAGGAAAISVWKSLHQQHDIYMADIDPCAAGLYLVPADRRLIIKKGIDPTFVADIHAHCKNFAIDVLIATVDTELAPLAEKVDEFLTINTKVPLSSYATLKICFDKYALIQHCKSNIPVPETTLLNADNEHTLTQFPYFAKPRFGAGSSGVQLVRDARQLASLPHDESYLIQEWLPGDEYSVDIYFNHAGEPIGAVPRLRMKIDSGIAVASRSVISEELVKLAVNTGKSVGIRYVANIQFKQALNGEYKLLEINPRFSGTLPLTCEAGVDTPKLMMRDLEGEKLTGMLPYHELMVVRYWTEKYIAPSEWEALCRK